MLLSLYIKNFILIEEMQVDLSDQFNAFTGETGAGKSLFVDALNFVAGERSSASVVGKAHDSAYVEAAFMISHAEAIKALKMLNFETEVNDTVVFSREMHTNGRSISRINGRVVNLRNIRSILEHVLDIHSQHETQYLLKDSNHIHLLDAYSNDENLLNSYQSLYSQYKAKLKEIEAFKSRKYDEDELEFAKFLLRDIENLDPSVSDYDEIDTRLKELENYESIKSNYTMIEHVLTDENNVLGSLYELMDAFKQIPDLYERFSDAYYRLEDISFEVSKLSSELYFDEFEYNQLNERMSEYTKLIRKYGSLDNLLIKKRELEDQINNVEHYQDLLDDLVNERDLIFTSLQMKADELSQFRREKALELENLIEKELRELMLENAVFRIDFSRTEFNQYGQDEVLFKVSLNKGIEPDLLSKVASGGELSRVMLGMKVIFSDIQGISTLIFDEIDSGVSGRVAFRIGEKMKDISKYAQVISITHLPAVAACADHHFLISKVDEKNKTITQIHRVEDTERIEQIAMMMTGSVNEETIKAAKNTLEQGQKI